MGKLYLVRHGQTLWNQEKRMQGHKNSDLSENGIAQANALKTHLDTLPLDLAVISPLGRVQQTADILLAGRDVPVYIEENVKEMGFGTWEGRVKPEIMENDTQAFTHFQTSPATFTTQAGETFYDVQDRVQPVIEGLIEKCETQNILVVSHTMTIKTILTILADYQIENFWDIPHIHPATLTTFNVEKGVATLETLGQSFL